MDGYDFLYINVGMTCTYHVGYDVVFRVSHFTNEESDVSVAVGLKRLDRLQQVLVVRVGGSREIIYKHNQSFT